MNGAGCNQRADFGSGSERAAFSATPGLESLIADSRGDVEKKIHKERKEERRPRGGFCEAELCTDDGETLCKPVDETERVGH